MGKDLRRRAVKGDVPGVKNDEPVGDARGVVHAVRDEQDGRAGLAPVGGDVFEHAAAARGVKAGRGLIEDEHLGAHGDHAGDGDAALLPAGELERRALEERLVHAGKARGLAHALIDLLRGEPGIFRAEGNVLIHRLLKELVLGILKDEADLKAHVARGGLAAVDVLPVEEHGAGRRHEQAVEVLNERALAGARVADDAHELPGGDGEINIVDGDFFKRRSGAVDVPEMIRPDDWRHNFVSFIYR